MQTDRNVTSEVIRSADQRLQLCDYCKRPTRQNEINPYKESFLKTVLVCNDCNPDKRKRGDE